MAFDRARGLSPAFTVNAAMKPLCSAFMFLEAEHFRHERQTTACCGVSPLMERPRSGWSVLGPPLDDAFDAQPQRGARHQVQGPHLGRSCVRTGERAVSLTRDRFAAIQLELVFQPASSASSSGDRRTSSYWSRLLDDDVTCRQSIRVIKTTCHDTTVTSGYSHGRILLRVLLALATEWTCDAFGLGPEDLGGPLVTHRAGEVMAVISPLGPRLDPYEYGQCGKGL